MTESLPLRNLRSRRSNFLDCKEQNREPRLPVFSSNVRDSVLHADGKPLAADLLGLSLADLGYEFLESGAAAAVYEGNALVKSSVVGIIAAAAPTFFSDTICCYS